MAYVYGHGVFGVACSNRSIPRYATPLAVCAPNTCISTDVEVTAQIVGVAMRPIETLMYKKIMYKKNRKQTACQVGRCLKTTPRARK
jgi:hypothetical protein